MFVFFLESFKDKLASYLLYANVKKTTSKLRKKQNKTKLLSVQRLLWPLQPKTRPSLMTSQGEVGRGGQSISVWAVCHTACQAWSHSDGFCQPLITDRSEEEGQGRRLGRWGGGGSHWKTRPVGGRASSSHSPPLCKQVNRLIHFSG